MPGIDRKWEEAFLQNRVYSCNLSQKALKFDSALETTCFIEKSQSVIILFDTTKSYDYKDYKDVT